MTELETLQRAKMYLDKLANGVNPLTDLPVAETDVVNNVRISRCLFYVSDVLRQLIERGRLDTASKPEISAKKRDKREPFSLTPEEIAHYEISEVPITAGEITRRLNNCLTDDHIRHLKNGAIASFLVHTGLLILTGSEGNSSQWLPTHIPSEAGKEIGIELAERESIRGRYVVTLYTAAAQRFILDNIEAIQAINACSRVARQNIDGSANSEDTPHDD